MRTGRLAGALMLAGLLAGCGVTRLSYPSPPSTAALTPSPTGVATNPAVAQGRVPGTPTTTAPTVSGGTATLSGLVSGPKGPVAGATIQVERLVGKAVATAQVTAGPDGSWTMPAVLGGRYRVRAWQAPTLAMTTAQIIFLTAGQTESLSLQVDAFSAPQVTTALAPPTPVVGEANNLVVQVVQPTVGSDGVVRPEPVADASVLLDGGSEWDVASLNPAATNASGQVGFAVSCQVVGSPVLAVGVAGGPLSSLTLPPCAPAPTPTTTTTTLPPSSTSTTAPGQVP